MCVYTIILECCSSNSVGRYSGYYYTVSMAAQVITPILSCVVMDVNPAMLFAYITGMGVLMGLSVAGAKHGDAILIDEVARREEAAEAEQGGCQRPCCRRSRLRTAYIKMSQTPESARFFGGGSFSSKCTLNP